MMHAKISEDSAVFAPEESTAGGGPGIGATVLHGDFTNLADQSLMKSLAQRLRRLAQAPDHARSQYQSTLL